MVKYIQGKNRLKDLIYIQENKPCSEKSIKGIIRSLLEPLFENVQEKGLVMYRFENEKEFDGLLKRLEYTSVDVLNLSMKEFFISSIDSNRRSFFDLSAKLHTE